MDKHLNELEVKRHSLAHILATAVLEMFPETKFAIGPTIENGFYYDFDLPRTLIPEDLPILEQHMRDIIQKNFPFVKETIDKKQAVELFQKAGQIYKVEILQEEADIQQVSIYKTHNFIDLCRGPHIDSTGEIDPQTFKLTKIAGAYWRGNEKNKMLQRIYGVAFDTATELQKYQDDLIETEKRNHRKIGKDLELFTINQNVGQGLILWQPKGAMLWHLIESFWYQEHLKNGYQLVRTPHIGSRVLWETSGHWNFYNESMYPPIEIGQSLEASQRQEKPVNTEEYLLKPMNCPFHVSIFNDRQRSYRELPIRWAECGTVYRYEKSGELSGLTRVRGFTQDDAHIICTKDQVATELKRVIKFIRHIFHTFGFDNYQVYLSLRDPKDKKHYTGTDEGWDFAQTTLERVAQEEQLDYIKEEGEAAFYGPKLDYKIKDCMGREWQCSTLQFDFNLPERFKMSYINEKGEKEQPYMLHRALFGSFERFIGVLTEHYAGAFPVWLSPIQIKLLPVSSEKHLDYAQQIYNSLNTENIRVEIDDSKESIGKKIRNAEQEKTPYILVLGDKEEQSNSVAVRKRGEKDIQTLSFDEFLTQIKQVIANK